MVALHGIQFQLELKTVFKTGSSCIIFGAELRIKQRLIKQKIFWVETAAVPASAVEL
jgi:hypothetical protein